MSTVVVVKKNGFVAIAADALTSFGPMKLPPANHANGGKIFRVGNSYLGSVGWTVHQQVLEHLFATVGAAPSFASAADIFDLFLALHPRLKQDYFLIPREGPDDAYESSQVTLLIANQAGIFGVFSMRTVVEYERFWATGSGSTYALGALQATYEGPGDARTIAEAAVRTAAEFDNNTGGPVDSWVLPLAAARAVDDHERLLKV